MTNGSRLCERMGRAYWSPTSVDTMTSTQNPAALSDYDPRWPLRAEQLLAGIREALRDMPGASGAVYDHIGSTSVPGLAAKPFVDLQVRMLPLPSDVVLIERLRHLGYRSEGLASRFSGSRPRHPSWRSPGQRRRLGEVAVRARRRRHSARAPFRLAVG
ncbi:GrpB family protein [Humibacter ginsengiterrae]